MSLYNYVDVPNTNLLCCICRAPFTDPITTVTCQHTFCRECITRALSHSPQCPVDRSPLSSADLGLVNPIVRSLVDELLVECVYHEKGCQHKLQRQLLANHLKDECNFSDSGRLRVALSKKELATQSPENAAPNLPGAEQHGSNISESLGSPSDSLFEVTSTEPTSATESAASASSQTGSSQPNSTSSPPHRVAQLTEQNIILQNRVESLEGTVQFLKKEMSMVRTVLGPWLQSANLSGLASTPGSNRNTPQSEGNHPPAGDLTFTEEPASPTTNIDNTQGERDNGSPNRNDLASYFPAEDEVRVRRTATQPPASGPQYTQTQRQRPPVVGHLHHHSVPSVPMVDTHSSMSPLGMGYLAHPSASPYAMGLYGSMLLPPSGGSQLQPIATTITDLDTSSPSLSTTLQGLHSNLVSLAASIDEIHRKSDLALALMGGGTGAAIPGGGVVGEVLRLGEEVMGVRATVQGMRMQMHNLMMGNVGVGGIATGGMAMGFSGRLQQPPNMNPAGEEGNTEGYALHSPISPGLQNQRPFYPVPPGITKL